MHTVSPLACATAKGGMLPRTASIRKAMDTLFTFCTLFESVSNLLERTGLKAPGMHFFIDVYVIHPYAI